jgi:hypothetical protein
MCFDDRLPQISIITLAETFANRFKNTMRMIFNFDNLRKGTRIFFANPILAQSGLVAATPA